jgi:hypothetical protein
MPPERSHLWDDVERIDLRKELTKVEAVSGALQLASSASLSGGPSRRCVAR